MPPADDTLHEQREWLRVTLSSIGDAVITTDTNGRITFLNPVAESLTGWSHDESLGQPLETVFKIINEGTRKSVENPATRALREGLVVDLANHTILLAKDGVERPIDDSAAPIRDRQDQVVGVVLVFRDVTQRRKQERALRESEERFRLLVETVKDYAIFMLDPHGVVASWNAGAERIKGYTASEIIGRHFSIFYPPEVVAIGFPALELETAAREGRFEDEGWRLRKDGSRFWANVVITAVRDDEGTLIGFSKVTRDLSERKAAETSLRESEELFRRLIEGVQDYAIFMLDPNGYVVSWNAGAQRIKGYRADEIIGQHFSRFYPQEAISTGFPDRELVLAGRYGRFEDEGWRIRKDGSRFWANVIITAVRDEAGTLKGFSKITRDLTERKAAEAALRLREERFRTLTESATDAIVSADANDCIVSWNRAATDIFGYAEHEAIGQPITMLLPHGRRGADSTNQSGSEKVELLKLVGQTVELQGREKEGNVFPIEVSLSSWAVEEGTFYTAIIRDISERKQKENALRQSQVLADLNRRKDEFMAMLSHELRNPLAPISTAVQLLRVNGRDDDPTRQQAMAILERQVGNLRRIVDDLLEVSRISTGRIRLQQEYIDLRSVAERAVDVVRPRLERREQKFSCSLPRRVIGVYADATRLEQIAVNLLTNASKYTPVGGEIRLTIEQEGNEAVLRVADTGVGIAPDLLPSVFDLFTQADRSLDRSEGGLGIGLTIVKRIVEMHGGKVDVFSAGLGQGSEFVAHLPVAKPEAEKTKPTPVTMHSATATGNGMRVLVVDDNKDAADSIAMLLKLKGHQIKVAYSSEAAMKLVADYHPDAILLDIGLPGTDGYEVARRLRKDPALEHVRLVAITGYGRETDQHRAREAGFDAHLVKPVAIDHLEQILATIADRRN